MSQVAKRPPFLRFIYAILGLSFFFLKQPSVAITPGGVQKRGDERRVKSLLGYHSWVRTLL